METSGKTLRLWLYASNSTSTKKAKVSSCLGKLKIELEAIMRDRERDR